MIKNVSMKESIKIARLGFVIEYLMSTDREFEAYGLLNDLNGIFCDLGETPVEMEELIEYVKTMY